MNATAKKTTTSNLRAARAALATLAGLIGLAGPALTLAATDTDDDAIARGAYLTAAGGCVSCHTDEDNEGAPFAGGHALKTPYGIFYTPNITPDKKTGIGGWSDTDFLAALRDGVAPDGSHYYPSFPYPSYAGMTRDDALAIKAYLDSLEPVHKTNQAHKLQWYVPPRGIMRLWKMLFAPWEYGPTAPGTQRGAYLVRHLGHCGECHTPRSETGALELSAELEGSPKTSDSKGAPAIRNSAKGLADWDISDVEFFLELGMTPDGDFIGGDMASVIEENTAKLTPDDRRAIALYLKSLE